MSSRTEYRIVYQLPDHPEWRHAGNYDKLEHAEKAVTRYEAEAANGTNLPGAVFRIEARTVTATDWMEVAR